MPRLLKRVILAAITTILSKDIDKYTYLCGSNFNETDVISKYVQRSWASRVVGWFTNEVVSKQLLKSKYLVGRNSA